MIQAGKVKKGTKLVIDGGPVKVTRVYELGTGQLRIAFKGDGFFRQRSFDPDEEIETP